MTAAARAWGAALALTVLAVSGCALRARGPDLGTLYDRAARHHDERRNPIILIPGVLGSRLEDTATGKTVWGAFDRDFADPRDAAGARLAALPMRFGPPLAALTDRVVATGALERLEIRLLGLPIALRAYVNILATLGIGGYRDEELGRSGAVDYGEDHYTCFQFPYDWRRDVVENAARLKRFIEDKRKYVAREIRRRYGAKNPEVKFDIVAHSMGGLITRYMLRYGDADLPADGSPLPVTWAGAGGVERVMLVGTPNAGALDSFTTLVRGISFGPFLPRYRPALVGTFPAAYQMLPRVRHGAVVDAADHSRRIDIYDPQVWIEHDWGLADPGEDDLLAMLLPEAQSRAERRRIALDHLEKCLARAAQLAAALDANAAPPPGLELYLYVGDAVETNAVAAAASDGSLRVIETGPGDGSVLRTSVLLDERVGGRWSPALVSPERWAGVSFLFSDHLGMTRDPAFADNVLYLLLEAPR